jgi:tetratricopeptide (TPR) repeat protein
MRYRAFISYSHADAATAAWLHRKLEAWRVPKRMRAENPALPDKLAPVFRDREELGSAGELGPQIQAALADSDALIVLCSPEAARSRWVDSEVRAFRAGGRGDRVFALIVSGEPHSGGERECFPPALRESEPLAADLRPGKDGRELALLKLIAGLLGVPLDTLRQREARRRHQRMLAVTSLAVVVMLVTSFLAVQASIARQAAERRQKQAVALVDFMLGDLNEKLTQVARLDIMEDVHDHAMDYFRSLPDTDVTDQSLLQRSRALTRIGNVRFEQGKPTKAKEAYLAAEKLAGQLAKAAPSNVERQLSHAYIVTYLGMAQWYEGDLDGAQHRFDDAQSILLRTQKLAPKNPDLLFQFTMLDNNAGHVLESRGRVDEAVVHYRRMLASSRKLAAIDPANLEWQSQIGLAHNNLAKMALLNGDLAGAVAAYRADLQTKTELAARDARNNAQAERLLWTRGALGRTLALTGDLPGGAAQLQLALDDSERLLGVESTSTAFQEDVVAYATQLARLRRLQGDGAEASRLVSRALALNTAMLETDKANPGWQRERADALLERALQGEGSSQAIADLRAALAILEPQLAQQPDDRGTLLSTLATRVALAGLEPPEQAMPRMRKSLAACEAQKSGRRDPRLRELMARMSALAGDHGQAASIGTELWREGFRDPGFATWLRDNSIAVPGVNLAGSN